MFCTYVHMSIIVASTAENPNEGSRLAICHGEGWSQHIGGRGSESNVPFSEDIWNNPLSASFGSITPEFSCCRIA
jgi:hypothetical protein